MTARGNPTIRAAETSVLSHGETGNLYVQQPQKGFQRHVPVAIRNRVGGLTFCGNTICRLIMLTTFSCIFSLSTNKVDRIRLIEHPTIKKSPFVAIICLHNLARCWIKCNCCILPCIKFITWQHRKRRTSFNCLTRGF